MGWIPEYLSRRWSQPDTYNPIHDVSVTASAAMVTGFVENETDLTIDSDQRCCSSIPHHRRPKPRKEEEEPSIGGINIEQPHAFWAIIAWQHYVRASGARNSWCTGRLFQCAHPVDKRAW